MFLSNSFELFPFGELSLTEGAMFTVSLHEWEWTAFQTRVTATICRILLHWEHHSLSWRHDTSKRRLCARWSIYTKHWTLLFGFLWYSSRLVGLSDVLVLRQWWTWGNWIVPLPLTPQPPPPTQSLRTWRRQILQLPTWQEKTNQISHPRKQMKYNNRPETSAAVNRSKL